jgi:hypothetical protein
LPVVTGHDRVEVLESLFYPFFLFAVAHRKPDAINFGVEYIHNFSHVCRNISLECRHSCRNALFDINNVQLASLVRGRGRKDTLKKRMIM